MAVALFLMPACKQETGAPVITSVKNYTVAPNDTLVDRLVPGQFAAIEGANLQEAIMITFNGVPAKFNTALLSNNSAVVRVPDAIPFPLVAEGDMNKIRYVTSSGETTFDLDIIPGPPSISGISNENPATGAPVTILGVNLFQIESLSFGGNLITDYQLASDGTMLRFIAPELTQSGPLVIRTVAGADSTIFNVNDFSTGMLCNFDDISPIGWSGSGAKVSDSETEFPGNVGKYAVLQNDVVNPWDWAAWDGGRIIILDPVQWLPAENINDSLDTWAVKFELNVPKAWNGNSLFVSSEHNDYRILFEPWKDAVGNTFSFTTDGWQTITLPLSLFANDWGRGAAPANFTGLLDGPTGNSAIAIQTMNISDAPSATGLKAAVDNIRIIKIK